MNVRRSGAGGRGCAPCRVWSTRWRCWTSSAPPGPLSEHPQPAGETRGTVLPEAAGGLRRWDALSLGRVCAEPWLVLVANSLGAMLRLQICFGFGDLMMVMAWGGSSGQGDSSSA